MPLFHRRKASQRQHPDPSSLPVGRWRRRAVPVTIATALAGAAAAGSQWLLLASRPERLAMESRQPLAELQSLLPGQSLQVPAGAGIRAWRQGGVDLVLLRARADGEAQRISLCDQRVNDKAFPHRIYPLALLARLPQPPVPLHARKNPVVLPQGVGDGLPTLWLEGDASDNPAATKLRLRVAAPAGAAAEAPTKLEVGPSSQVAMAEPRVPGQAGNDLAFDYTGQAWVLWSAPSPGHAAWATSATAAKHAASASHQHAVRLRTVAHTGCAAGALEWQLFSSTGLSDRDLAAPATLWARSARLGGADALRMRVPTGEYRVPEVQLVRLEDRELFEQALQSGLIKPLSADGPIALAPADAWRAAGAAQAPPGPASSNAGASASAGAGAGAGGRKQALLKALHHSANGAFVRAQLAEANQSTYWMAVRVRQAAGGQASIGSDFTAWRAMSAGELLPLEQGLPAVSARLFNAPPTGWDDWVRVRAPQTWATPDLSKPAPGAAPAVRLQLPLRKAAPGEVPPAVVLLVLGRVADVSGAELTSTTPACSGPGCAVNSMLNEVRLSPRPGARELVLTLHPEPLFNRLRPAATEQQRVQWRQGKLAWVEPPANSGVAAGARAPSAEVRVTARDGSLLYAADQPAPQAQALGLVPLVGLGPQHGHSLAGGLARLGRQGQAQAQAGLTIEPRLQAALHDVLACQGMHDGTWRADEDRCVPMVSPTFIDGRRSVSAVVMDAGTGEILAVVSGADLPADAPAADLLAFDAFNPAGSPLRLGAWQHDGGTAHSPGSVFKLANALALEQAAQSRPELEQLLAGVPPAQLNSLAQELGTSFEAASACYPAPCAAGRVQVHNYRDAPTVRYARDGRMGLVDAMRNSVNTWFALLMEATDRSVRMGHADARPLGDGAMRAERPTLAVLQALGFGQMLALDGGLLPQGFAWQPGDALQAMASQLDPIHDAHGVRQQAMGLRMQTTTLQWARTAAGIATGSVPQPRLLASLNGVAAQPGPGQVLKMPLARTRKAMSEVVAAGTAAGAFAAPGLQSVRSHVFGKTGSAPLASADPTLDCNGPLAAAPVPTACLNNAWFVGYLAPGALPGEPRTLAFAVRISHTRRAGGAHAAPVVAGWIATLWARQNAALAAAPQRQTALAGLAAPGN